MEMDYPYYGDRADVTVYEAVHPEHGTRLLQTSGYRFTPTQERFEWLVEHGTVQRKVPSEFGYQGVIGVPWDNESIDNAIKNEADCCG